MHPPNEKRLPLCLCIRLHTFVRLPSFIFLILRLGPLVSIYTSSGDTTKRKNGRVCEGVLKRKLLLSSLECTLWNHQGSPRTMNECHSRCFDLSTFFFPSPTAVSRNGAPLLSASLCFPRFHSLGYWSHVSVRDKEHDLSFESSRVLKIVLIDRFTPGEAT